MADNILENKVEDDKIVCPIERCWNRGDYSNCYIPSDDVCPFFLSSYFLEKRIKREQPKDI